MRPEVALMAALTLTCGCTSTVTIGESPPGRAPRGADVASVTERACAGLTDADVARVIDELRANVEGVQPVRETDGEKAIPRTRGAVVRVRATPGMTAEWMTRVLRCETARRPVCAPAGDCALVPADAAASVRPAATGFSIAIRSRDPETAREIARRAEAFAHRASVDVGGPPRGTVVGDALR